jgi:isoleucyl-tRNA synthetase
MEEKYVLSRLQSTILEVSEHFDQYRLNETPGPIERFLVDTLSHTYLQLVWEKASLGTEDEKKAVLSVVHYSLTTAMTLMAPVMPFFTEEVYQNLKKGFPTVSATLAKEDSVHLRSWPVAHKEWIDEQLENDLDVAKDAITAILAGRDRLALGTKWPLQEVRITATQSSFLPSLKRCEDLILKRTNVKYAKLLSDGAELGHESHLIFVSV